MAIDHVVDAAGVSAGDYHPSVYWLLRVGGTPAAYTSSHIVVIIS